LYELGPSAWLERVRDNCKDVTILSHAAAFFDRWDKEFAIQLIESVRQIEPGNSRLLRDREALF
jgi:hypothetical protein